MRRAWVGVLRNHGHFPSGEDWHCRAGESGGRAAGRICSAVCFGDCSTRGAALARGASRFAGDLAGLPSGTTRYLTRDDLLALPQVSYTVCG